MDSVKFSECKLTPIKSCFVTDENRKNRDNQQQSIQLQLQMQNQHQHASQSLSQHHSLSQSMNIINSPFPFALKTPSKVIDFPTFSYKNSNEQTPLNDSMYSPFISASQKKNEYNWLMVPKQLFVSELSPFRPQQRIGGDLANDNNNNNRGYCRNLSSQFESVVNTNLIGIDGNNQLNSNESTEDSLIETNQLSTHFVLIKKALFNDENYSLSYNEHNDDDRNAFGDHCNDNNDIRQRTIHIKQFNQIYINAFGKEMRNDLEGIDNEKDNESQLEESNLQVDYTNPLFNPLSTNRDEYTTCKCSKSKCLKFYCDCFAKGNYCKDCSCLNCFNQPKYNPQRTKALNRIKSNNPISYQSLNSKRTKRCHCKNSSCQKNYCDCYQSNKHCSTKCKCFNCLNKPLLNNKRGRAIKTRTKAKERVKVSDNGNTIEKTKTRTKQVLTNDNRKKSNKDQKKMHITITTLEYNNAMYTPQKKNYRHIIKSDIKNTISTAVYTQCNNSGINNKRNRKQRMIHSQKRSSNSKDNINNKTNTNTNIKPLVCKMLEMKSEDTMN